MRLACYDEVMKLVSYGASVFSFENNDSNTICLRLSNVGSKYHIFGPDHVLSLI